MTQRMIVMLLVVGVLLAGVFGFIIFRNHMIASFMASRGIPPQTVSTTIAKFEDWQPKLEGVGTLRASKGADLSSEVAGIVSAIHFESGVQVKAGQLLVELASGDDVAKLNSLKAVAALARITLDRDRRQLQAQGVSQQTVDTDQANLKGAVAQVAQQQATLEYKRIRAPFDGALGIRQVDVGQYLSPGTTMVTLQALDPIFVDFYMPEQSLALLRVGQKLAARTDAFAGRDFPGQISAINSKIDATTRNVEIRATIPNPDHLLLPGMYARVEIDAGAPQRAMTLPQTAVAYSSYGNIVYLVTTGRIDVQGHAGLVANSTFVTTGATRGDQVQILSGVKEGDTVVTAGQIKLRSGMPVIVKNDIAPKSDADPLPVDR
jgi:membrane fusion protein (multidrug efflux system)